MITLNNKTKLPSIIKSQWGAEIIFVVTIFSMLFSFISGSFLGTFLTLYIIFGLPLSIIILLQYNSISFILENDKITINYGIIVKHSNTIPFHNIQNIENRRSISSQLFGVAVVNIWTASPKQTNSRNERKPDGKLYLRNSEADWLKDFILSKRT